jgi:hypothetical protein
MAFINSDNRYIRLLPDGSFEVYASVEARDKIKNSTDGQVILAKYRELLKELAAQEDFICYDPDGFAEVYGPLEREYDRYWYNLDHYIVGQEYPIMAQHYPDVADSIPEIVEKCHIRRMGETVEEAYINAKQLKRFGETTDA